jgi:hypothetical protein
MSYRDEREALRQRVEDLEQELARARRQIEEAQAVRSKTDRLEVELAATQRTLDRIRGELRSGRQVAGGSRRGMATPLLFVLFGITAWTAAALGVLTRPGRTGPCRSLEHEDRMPPIMTMAEAMADRKVPNVVRSGSVASVSGDALVAAGAECSVSVKPARLRPGINCKVSVQCGAETIYGEGESGYARCEVRDGSIASAVDTESSASDSDPVLALDLPARRLIVSDTGLRSYKVEIDLAEPGTQTEL